MNYAVLGAKAGSKKARTPVISPDSAQSKTYMRILLAITEGEIPTLADLYKRILFNETPLMSDDGSYNFQDVKVDFRPGTNDQTYIEGFPDVSSEIDVNVELKSGTPYVRAFNNLDLDGVNVRIKFGALRTQNATNGDVTGVTIQYAIDLQTDGGTWTEVLNTQISDKTSTNYERSHRVNLPKADTGWQIRIRRLTPNSNSELISDKMYIAAVTEVIDAKLSYPNVALLGLQFDAETFGGSVPKIAILAKGLIIRVPSNYDPVSRTYSTPIWDGTFKDAYTDNPVWHFYNTCIEKRYALGHHINSSMIDKWDCYRLAQWCDQLVSDGKGGQEPRFRVNVYQQNQEDAWAFLQRLAGVFRAFIYWDGTAIRLEADVPQDVEFVYTQANVIEGSFEYNGTRKRDRHSVAYIKYDNPANLYKTETVVVSDDEAIQKYGINPLNIDAWGVTSEAQAQRAGLAALISEKYETRLVTFKVGLDGYCPRPGRVFGVADYLFAGRMNGGRVSAISANLKSVTLDRDDVIAQAGDRLVINGENGKAQARIVESISGRVVNVTFAFDENSVAAQNIWAIDAQDLATMKFRCISITQDEDHQFTITGLQYNAAKFNAIDFGAVIDERPISVINPTVQKPVESVTLSTQDMVQQGMTVATMNIVWPQVEGAVKYQVEWRKDDGSWMKLPITGNNSVEVQGIYSGNYQAKVSAINAFEIASLPVYSTLTELSGKQGLPPKLAFIQATGILFGIKLDWGFPASGALDTAYTEIEVSPDSTSNIAQLGLFAYPTTTHTIQGMQPNLRQYYRGRLIDRIGNVGDWSDWVSGVSSADASDVLDLLHDQISESQLNQDLKEKIERIEVIDGDIADIIQSVQNVENGITQERSERIAGDDQVLNQLTIYKLSNDQKVAAVVENVDLVMNEQEVQAKKIDGVYAQVNPPLIGSESDLIGNNSGYAGVWSEQSARIEGDLAQSKRTDQVVATIKENDALYKQQIKANASAISSTIKVTETLQTKVGENSASIQNVSESVDGIYAQQFTKFDVNGHVSGHGSMNDGTTSTFIFNYDAIQFGTPVGVDDVEPKPLMTLQNTPVTLPNGTVIPRGLYVDNGSFGYINANRIWAENLSVISADLGTIKVKTANIEDGAIDTLKIKDEAVTVPIGVKAIDVKTITTFAGGVTSGQPNNDFNNHLSAWENHIGTLLQVTLNRSGGKVRIDASVNICTPTFGAFSVSDGRGNPIAANDRAMASFYISIYKNGSLIGRGSLGANIETGNINVNFNGTAVIVSAIDDNSTIGNVTYTLKAGFARQEGVNIPLNVESRSNFMITSRTLSVIEMKK